MPPTNKSQAQNRKLGCGARLLLAVGLGLVWAALVPRWWCGRDAQRFYEGETRAQQPLARYVARVVTEHSGREFYRSGNLRADGQSAIAIYQMALLGLGQIVLEHPEQRDEYLPAMERAAERLIDPLTLRYATAVYGRHGLASVGPHTSGHAYLGYINLGLGMLRAVDPGTRHAALHDRLSAELARRLAESPTGMIETYPGESWPPDISAVAGSVGLHAAVTHTDRRALLDGWAARFERCAVDRSGWLVQRVASGSCKPLDAPRGTGTALAAYFLSFAAPELARRLHQSWARDGTRSLFGFGAVREYPPGFSGRGDGNSGPVLFGISIGSSGFALGSARAHRDERLFIELYRSAHLVGVPVERDEEQSFALGGVLGNALLLAMLTARPP